MDGELVASMCFSTFIWAFIFAAASYIILVLVIAIGGGF